MCNVLCFRNKGIKAIQQQKKQEHEKSSKTGKKHFFSSPKPKLFHVYYL